MVMVTRTCSWGYDWLRYEMLCVQEAEKTTELRTLHGPQPCVWCDKRSAENFIARYVVKLTIQTDRYTTRSAI